MKKLTHKQKVLALLSDGKPHGHMELYRLGCVAHSRVSDLRKDGYVIEQWRDGDQYLYQLLAKPLEPSAETGSGPHPVRPLADGSSGPLTIPSGRGSEPSADGVAQPAWGEAASEPKGPLVLQLVLDVPVTSREREAA